jgi:hypothetical protein
MCLSTPTFSAGQKYSFLLAATLSIRNTDLSLVRVTSIDYSTTRTANWSVVTSTNRSLWDLASTYVHIQEKDVSGGFGAILLSGGSGQDDHAPSWNAS